MTRLPSIPTRFARTRARAALAALAIAALAARAPGQPCTSGCETLVAQQGLSCINGLANESGASASTSAVFAHQCGMYPTGFGFHVSHASHFTPPSTPFQFNHVCIGLSGASFGATTTPLGAVNVQLFSGPSTIDPDAGTSFAMSSGTYTINSDRILVPVGNLTVNGPFWVVVSYNNVHPQLHRQFVGPRTGGRAMLRLSGNGVTSSCYPAPGDWWDYDQVAALASGQGTVFGNAAPVIRPLRLASSPSGTAAIIATPSAGLFTAESGLTARFTLKLTEPPNGFVMLRVTTSDATEARLLNSSGVPVDTLTVGAFTSASFNVPRPVDIIGVNDASPDGDQDVTLNVTFESGDTQYAAATAQVAARNRDNDDPSAVPQRQWAIAAVGSPPAARRLYALAYDDARQELVLFGGRNAFGTTFGDTWAYKNNQWTLKTISGPLPRWSPAMAYDSTRQVTVLFGGYAPVSGAYNDTWEWNGTSWIQRFPANVPGTRGDHALAYDSDRQRMVLYGGRNGPTGLVYSDTLELIAAPPPTYTWQPRNSNAPPGQRMGHGLAYDPDLDRTYLFGGYFGGGQLGGTYAWNGSVWSLVSSSGPAERMQHAMAFDRQRRRTVIQGGFDGGIMFNDTWEWNGGGWTLLASGNGPQRAMHRMASSASVLHMFGGVDASNTDRNDLWMMNANVITRTFAVAGTGTGATFQIGVTGSGWGAVTPGLSVVPGAPAATIASVIAGAVSALPGVAGAAPLPGAPRVIAVSFLGSGGVLSGVPAAQPARAIIRGSPAVVVNPTIEEIYLSGADCNENGMDDTIDLLDDPSLDANGNGAMDACEPPPPPPPCPGDIDGDFVVGIADLLSLLAAWGECDADDCPADFDGDLAVGINDLLAVLAAWGGCDGGADG